MTFLVLHVPGANAIGCPRILVTFGPIILQHLQFLWLLQGRVHPVLLFKAIDFNTDNLDPMFEAVFFANWKSEPGLFLKVFVFNKSSSCFLIDFVSFSSVPKQEMTRIGTWVPLVSADVSSELAIFLSIFFTLLLMLSNIFLG